MYIKQNIDLEEAKKRIENGEIVSVNEQDRGVGKTTLIVAYSNWTGIPILATNEWKLKLLKGMGARYFHLAPEPSKIIGHRFPKGVLIDGEVDKFVLEYLERATSENGSVSGFLLERSGKL